MQAVEEEGGRDRPLGDDRVDLRLINSDRGISSVALALSIRDPHHLPRFLLTLSLACR